MAKWASSTTLWLRGKLRNVKFLRASYHWLMVGKYRDGLRKLAHGGFVFLMAAMYFLLLTPYAIIRRYLPGGSLLRARSGWNPNPQTTADTNLFDRMI